MLLRYNTEFTVPDAGYFDVGKLIADRFNAHAARAQSTFERVSASLVKVEALTNT
jgi:hypothetical protein